MSERVIAIAKDFSTYPGGRFRKDGDFSGEAFRDDLLIPSLKQAENAKDTVVVVLDGTFGYAASFLDEAFGGLVRERHFDKKQLSRLLSIKATAAHMQLYKQLAEQYIDEAGPTMAKQSA